LARWRLPAASIGAVGVLTSALVGCPNQELAPLAPCTVSGVSIEVPQTGVDKVDLLFMIDDSGSMAEEQKKLADVLPNLVTVLTTGNKTPKPAGATPDFPPVKSLHIGVISQDMGVNLIGYTGPMGFGTAPKSCGPLSYIATAPDPGGTGTMAQSNPLNQMTVNKPFGDDAASSCRSMSPSQASTTARRAPQRARTRPCTWRRGPNAKTWSLESSIRGSSLRRT